MPTYATAGEEEHAAIRPRMLTYADVCWRMLTYATAGEQEHAAIRQQGTKHQEHAGTLKLLALLARKYEY